MERETPSAVMYADFKRFGHISNRDAAKILLSDKPMYGGNAPSDRVDERTFLSREVVHAEPGHISETLFANFNKSSQALASQMMRKVGGDSPAITIISHYAYEGRDLMCSCLQEWNLDASLYSNMVDKVLAISVKSAADRASLLVLLFCATGSLGDPKRACQLVETFANSLLGAEFRTSTLSAENFVVAEEPEASSIGLARVVNGRMKATIFPINDGPEGTTIGSLATAESTITDVGADVSRKHARIWTNDGHWYIEDLNSTNGTAVIRGADKSVTQIASGQSTELFASDVVCLGASTRFMVMSLAL